MLHDEPFVKLGASENNLLSVSPDVNTKAYHDAFLKMPVPKPVAEAAYVQAGRILQKAAGKDEEYLVAIDAKTGTLIADNLHEQGVSRSTTFTGGNLEAVRAHPGSVITVHNHPHSFGPSYQDIITASRNRRVATSIVVGHDGSVWYVSAPSECIADDLERYYNQVKDYMGDRAELYALDLLNERARKVGLTWMKLR